MDDETLDRLVTEAQAGNAEAFGAIFDAYGWERLETDARAVVSGEQAAIVLLEHVHEALEIAVVERAVVDAQLRYGVDGHWAMSR